MIMHQAASLAPKTPAWIVAIDTSSDYAGVALFDGTQASVIAWNARRDHTVSTLAQLDHLLRVTGIDLLALDAIAVAIGPGSFSALRVGLSIAKGLAFSLELPVLGIPTTDAIAAQLGWTERPVVAVMTAGRGRVVWSRYERGALAHGPHNTTVEELRANIDGVVVAGETSALGDLPVAPLPAGWRVEQIARLGWDRLLAGERDDASLLEPIYAHGRHQKAVSV